MYDEKSNSWKICKNVSMIVWLSYICYGDISDVRITSHIYTQILSFDKYRINEIEKDIIISRPTVKAAILVIMYLMLVFLSVTFYCVWRHTGRLFSVSGQFVLFDVTLVGYFQYQVNSFILLISLGEIRGKKSKLMKNIEKRQFWRSRQTL